MAVASRENAEVFWKCIENFRKFFEKIFTLVAEAFKNLFSSLDIKKIQAFLKTKKTHYFRYMAWIKLKNYHRSVKNYD